MKLATAQACKLLARHGCYLTEACDNCGRVLGPLRFTRKSESGAWCSRECRDRKEAHAPGTCKGCGARLPEGKRRGTLYCDDACRKSGKRTAVRTAQLSRTKLAIYAAFSMGKRASGISGRPGPFGGLGA